MKIFLFYIEMAIKITGSAQNHRVGRVSGNTPICLGLRESMSSAYCLPARISKFRIRHETPEAVKNEDADHFVSTCMCRSAPSVSQRPRCAKTKRFQCRARSDTGYAFRHETLNFKTIKFCAKQKVMTSRYHS